MLRLKVKVGDRWYEVEVGDWEGDRVRVMVDGEEVTVSLDDVAQAGVESAPSEADAQPESTGGESDNVVRSPLPGVVISIDVAVGDSVAAGERVCVLEAMKMEQELVAASGGRVRAVRVQKGQSVLIGQTIVELE